MKTIIFAVFCLLLAGCGRKTYDQQEAARILVTSGFELAPLCQEKGQGHCLSLAGIRRDTVAGLIKLREHCACDHLRITGGTEEGHVSSGHRDGYTVDLVTSGVSRETFNRCLRPRSGKDPESQMVIHLTLGVHLYVLIYEPHSTVDGDGHWHVQISR